MFAVVVAAALVLTIGSVMIGIASTNTERARSARQEEQLVQAARSGMAQAKFLVWERYIDWASGAMPPGYPANGNLAFARQYLDTQVSGVAISGQNLTANTTIDLVSMNLAPRVVAGMDARGERVWVRVTAARQDPDNNSTLLLLRAVATSWDPATGDRAARLAAGLPADQRTAELVLRYGGALYNGFDFALLANAINCTFCHAEIDNSHRMYNTDPTKYGTFDRVKVASLETLEMRSNQQSLSRIAGTLYVQGTVVDENGNPLTPNGAGNIWGSSGLRSVAFDSTTGKIQESSSSNPISRLTPTSFTDSHKDGSGNYDTPYGNFYKGYPTDPAMQVDGMVPDKFPPVVADDNMNRLVDDAEWFNHTAGGFNGSIGGGIARVMLPKDGSTPYTHTRLPIGNGASGANETANIPVGGTTNNSVILVGTAANPITIDGDVAIDGDVVISGYVKGTGQLLARGNIYVVGDLQYADGVDGSGKRTFGVAQDGTPNTVAYAAGGSILHGSFLWGGGLGFMGVPSGTNTGVTGQGNEQGGTGWDVGFAMNELGFWNRSEWGKSMPNYSSGTNAPTNASTGTANVGYEPGYMPRFYTIRDGGEVWLTGPNKNHTDLWGTQYKWYNTGDGFWNGDARLDFYHPSASEKLSTMGADMPGSYTTLPLLPKFVSETALRSIQRNGETDRKNAAGPWAGQPAGKKKYKLDGLFYTNNAMLFVARQSGNDNSADGQIEFNGAVVAADTGILAPNKMSLNYDYRTKEFLKIEDRTEVQLYVVLSREGV